jgi:hypothetical protein
MTAGNEALDNNLVYGKPFRLVVKFWENLPKTWKNWVESQGCGKGKQAYLGMIFVDFVILIELQDWLR